MSMAHRILLVDDLPMFRELGSLFLARSGRVELASTAAQAFEKATLSPPTVVVADMHLPDLSGTELCRHFKTQVGPDGEAPRVLLLARPDSKEDHAEAVRAGADEVLFKPLERDRLVASVRRLTDFSVPKGLPRARLEQPIEITTRGSRVEGSIRNVSCGGLYVETPVRFSRREEVGVSFQLDEDGAVLSPTAQVVWSEPGRTGHDGVGLRFLEMDAMTLARLERYVNEHFPRAASLPG